MIPSVQRCPTCGASKASYPLTVVLSGKRRVSIGLPACTSCAGRIAQQTSAGGACWWELDTGVLKIEGFAPKHEQPIELEDGAQVMAVAIAPLDEVCKRTGLSPAGVATLLDTGELEAVWLSFREVSQRSLDAYCAKLARAALGEPASVPCGCAKCKREPPPDDQTIDCVCDACLRRCRAAEWSPYFCTACRTSEVTE